MSAGLPFTPEEFLDLFARYNAATWPLPLVAFALAVGVVALAVRARPEARAVGLAALAAFWAVTGALYHLRFFRSINPAAAAFASCSLAALRGRRA